MIVAITGGTGFVGRKLVLRHLALGDEVRVLSRREPASLGLPEAVQWHCGDLAGPARLRNFVNGASVLYHCAAEIRDRSRMEAVNVHGTRKLLEAAAGNIGRWVQLSSVGAYGPQRAGIITEDSPLAPRDVYETTKVKSDAMVETDARNGAFAHVILRPSIVYGTEMSNRSLFSLIATLDRGWFFFIGEPGASANYVHVDNVIEALVLCGKSPQAAGRIYNLSDHRNMEIFIAIIAAALGREAPRTRLPEAPVRLLARLFGKLPGMPLTEARIDALTNRACYPAARIEQELGYRHAVSMEQGLTELVDFWKHKSGKTG